MTDDNLVKRLREMPTYSGEPKGPHWTPNLAADRIEALEREKREAALDALAAHGQAHDAYEAQLKAEARLAKAVEALREIAAEASVRVETKKHGGISHKKLYEGWRKLAVKRIDTARAVLAEIEGGKKDD